MKFLIDFLPTLIFFLVFKWFDIFAATAALMGATALQIIVLKLLRYPIEKMHWITLGFVAVFGTLTLVFHDDAFIKWKVTIIYTLFATILFVASKFYQKNILQSMLGKEVQAPASMWQKVNMLWIGFFLACAVLNLVVAYQFSQDAWVNFKLFGLTGMTLVCSLITGWLLLRHQNSTSA